MRKATITAAIIAKNEERNIRDCIESVRGWADEIVLIDGCSTDNTAAIARSLGAKVVDHKFEGSFAMERNLASENSASDWVLHLDADDRVTADFKAKADQILGSDPGVDVYKFRRKSFFLGHFMEYGGWYHYIPNLTRRGKVKFEGSVHERPVFSGKIVEIDADIEHHPYQNISQFMERHNRYSTIDAMRIFEAKGLSEEANVKRNIVRKSFKIFWKIYIKKKGRREGLYGLVFAILFAFENFLVWVKYWEICINSREAKKAK